MTDEKKPEALDDDALEDVRGGAAIEGIKPRLTDDELGIRAWNGSKIRATKGTKIRAFDGVGIRASDGTKVRK